MKKVIIAVMVMAVASSYADLRTYASQTTFMTVDGSAQLMPDSGLLTGDLGGGAAWAYAIYDVTTDAIVPGDTDASIVNAGWYDSLFGGMLLGGFNFTVNELDNVALRVYNSDNSWFIDSVAQVVPDLTDPIAPGSDAVTFDFTGQSWQAIPEPATIGLMGIAGLGMFLARRKARR